MGRETARLRGEGLQAGKRQHPGPLVLLVLHDYLSAWLQSVRVEGLRHLTPRTVTLLRVPGRRMDGAAGPEIEHDQPLVRGRAQATAPAGEKGGGGRGEPTTETG